MWTFEPLNSYSCDNDKEQGCFSRVCLSVIVKDDIRCLCMRSSWHFDFSVNPWVLKLSMFCVHYALEKLMLWAFPCLNDVTWNLTLRKNAIWLSKNCQKHDIFFQKNCQKFSLFFQIFWKKKSFLQIFLKKMSSFW